MYDASQSLTNDTDSINIFQHNEKTLIAEFTINKARQIDVVDRIGKHFSYDMSNYSQSSISFPAKPTKKKTKKSQEKYTATQGQYLAFIYYYTKIHRMSPAELDFQKYFRRTPPTVHNMIVKLEEKGFIQRKPKTPRSIKLLLSRDEIPDLD
ncbi:MarR family transcriptional regulator [Desulfobacterales bacterium HSG17]|nr:MarR family transcriptional regulator [Desulfobacterales bacterium HSG17]